MRTKALTACLAAACLAAALAAPAAPAAPQTAWLPLAVSAPTNVAPGGSTELAIYAQNVGGAPSAGAKTLTFTLPPGVTTSKAPATSPAADWSCAAPLIGQSSLTCTSALPIDQGFATRPLRVEVGAAAGAQSGTVEIEVSGGGAAEPASYEMPLTVSALDAPPGMQSFSAGAFGEDGVPDTRAGGHPYSASAGIFANTVRSESNQIVPAGEFRDIFVDTPPGFFGNPTAIESCPESVEHLDCPHESIAAVAQVVLQAATAQELQERSHVTSVQAPFGYPAKFRFETGLDQVLINVVASLRSDEDYGLQTGSYDTAQIKPVFGSFFTIWGTPFAASHDANRCRIWQTDYTSPPADCETRDQIVADGGKEVAFLTSPLDCAEEAQRPPVATINVNTWQSPGQVFSSDVALEPVRECDHPELKAFDADFSFEPTSAKAADSPASFRTEVRTPNEGLLDPDKRTNPTIRETVVELPEGVALNASAADGLQACSFSQIGYKGNEFPRPNEIRFDKAPDSCPDASKIGSGELNSELIAEPLQADLFLAEQGAGNPFGSLFAIYLVIENPRNGIFIKLPAEVQLDPLSGKQTVLFRDLPPLPFTNLTLDLKGGPRSPLATPTTCGSYSASATNTPWSAPESGPPLLSPAAFAVERGPGGLPCANTPGERPFALGFDAGTANPLAGAHGDFQMQITRPDGHQEIDRLEIATPPGFAASLRGIPYCSEAQIAAAAARESGRAEQASPSCPAAAQIGTANAAAGSGPNPFYAPGKLYLAGPYRGQALSVVAITPALAGPFDLGNVVVRSAVAVNRSTARITALTDPLPRVHKGVPLRIRDVRINLDRDGWALNPTSCEPLAVELTAHGANGAVSTVAKPFQVGRCGKLGFKPRTRLRLFGGIKRGKYQGVRAVVRPRPGDANISRTAVRFPRSAFVAQEHIRTVCTRVQFAADACPKGSIYGRAIAYSPLLDYPLRGNVYLRSSDNELPDAVADLRGPAHQPIKVEVAIRNDSVKGALRNTVLAAPDAPVSYFRLQMFGGDKGLIVNSRNICRGKNKATVGMRAHNGRRWVRRVSIFNKRCKKARQKARKKRRAKRSAHAAKRAGGRNAAARGR
jgi:hypothetical protein